MDNECHNSQSTAQCRPASGTHVSCCLPDRPNLVPVLNIGNAPTAGAPRWRPGFAGTMRTVPQSPPCSGDTATRGTTGIGCHLESGVGVVPTPCDTATAWRV